MKFHLFASPSLLSSKNNWYSQKTRQIVHFSTMMIRLGYQVIHYGHADSDLNCSECVEIISEEEHRLAYSEVCLQKYGIHTSSAVNEFDDLYHQKMSEALMARCHLNDVLISFDSHTTKALLAKQSQLCSYTWIDAHDAFDHAPSLSFYKIFPSYASYHAFCGEASVGFCQQSWFDAVIPYGYDLNDFPAEPVAQKDDYFVFLGGLNGDRGLQIALDVTARLNKPLKIMGLAHDYLQHTLPPHAEFLGCISYLQMIDVVANAKAGIVAPRGLNEYCPESLLMSLAGTAVISSDWGEPVEYNLHGLSGYRCRTMSQFHWAAAHIDDIDPALAQQWARKNYNLDAIAALHERYIKRIISHVAAVNPTLRQRLEPEMEVYQSYY